MIYFRHNLRKNNSLSLVKEFWNFLKNNNLSIVFIYGIIFNRPKNDNLTKLLRLLYPRHTLDKSTDIEWRLINYITRLKAFKRDAPCANNTDIKLTDITTSQASQTNLTFAVQSSQLQNYAILF